MSKKENEKNILIDLRTTMQTLTKAIEQSKTQIFKINEDIKQLDNNYFVETSSIIHSCSNNDILSRLQSLQYFLFDCEDILSNNIDNICDHEWTDDEIDITPERSASITYCRKCDVSKKNNKYKK